MKKIISLILVLTMCIAFSSCAVNPEKYSLALAANAMEVYHDYIVDRAFGFVITDSYGAVLFSGVVNSVN